MILGISYQSVAAYIFLFIVGILFLTALASPLKKLFKVLVSSAIGTIGLLIFNFIGNYFGFTVGINLWTIITMGILGLPGFILLVFLRAYLF